jgi:hypothetical protein
MTSASASRVTRSRLSLRLALWLLAGVAAGITVLRAQETPPVPEPVDAPTSEPATTATPSSTPATAKPAAPAAAGPAKPVNPPASSTSSPARFEPTEKVRADFDVSFPIDI